MGFYDCCSHGNSLSLDHTDEQLSGVQIQLEDSGLSLPPNSVRFPGIWIILGIWFQIWIPEARRSSEVSSGSTLPTVCLVGKGGAGVWRERKARGGEKKEEDKGKGGREGDHGEESGSGG